MKALKKLRKDKDKEQQLSLEKELFQNKKHILREIANVSYFRRRAELFYIKNVAHFKKASSLSEVVSKIRDLINVRPALAFVFFLKVENKVKGNQEQFEELQNSLGGEFKEKEKMSEE
mmetsp:Transcript_14699/g.22782  ORF Transcript_14699/g.22782 Transcript_14699/m.22782 type:complete len:118 (+) Transcript_14699:352-705(+)